MTTISAYPQGAASQEGLAENSILPAAAYHDEAFFQREQEEIFRNSWLFGCFARDVQSPGTIVPVEVRGEPVIILRDTAGVLRAFHNVCTHRGTKLVCEPKSGKKTITCPYHAWIYRLSGELMRAQHYAGKGRSELPDRAPAQLGLKPLAVGTWLDFVFVNFDVDAEPFDQYINPLRERWAEYDLSVMRFGASLRYDFRANWKFIVENFLESYHVPFIHQTLNTYSPFSGRHQIKLADHIYGIGQDRYVPDAIDGTRLPAWPIEPAREHVRAEYYNVFPTFLIGLMPDHLFAWWLDPLAADRTTEFLAFYFVGEEALSPRFEPHREATLKNWKQVNDEDWEIVELMQDGSRSSAFTNAILSRQMERNINGFQSLVAARAGLPDGYATASDDPPTRER